MSKKNPHINWPEWEGRQDLTPEQGAMLACGIDPGDTQNTIPWNFPDQVHAFSEHLEERSKSWKLSDIESEWSRFRKSEKQSTDSSFQWTDRLVRIARAIEEDNQFKGHAKHLQLMDDLRMLLDDQEGIVDTDNIIVAVKYDYMLATKGIVDIVIKGLIDQNQVVANDNDAQQQTSTNDDGGLKAKAIADAIATRRLNKDDDPYGWKANAQLICNDLRKEFSQLSKKQICEKVHAEMTKRHEAGDLGMTGRGNKIPAATNIESKNGIKW